MKKRKKMAEISIEEMDLEFLGRRQVNMRKFDTCHLCLIEHFVKVNTANGAEFRKM